MRPSRGMGAINPSKMPKAKTITRKDDPNKVTMYAEGGKVSRVNEAGNYTKPGLRKSIFERIKAGGKGGAPGQWSARKAQMMALQYKKAGGGYKELVPNGFNLFGEGHTDVQESSIFTLEKETFD